LNKNKHNLTFISVNYNSSNLIISWIKSIDKLVKKKNIIIVDNYFSNVEVSILEKLSKKLNFILLKSNNYGYSYSLNLALKYFKKNINIGTVFCGNLDIEFLKIDFSFVNKSGVFVPIVIEKKRKNRNPFLTKFQKKIFPFYKIAAIYKSSFLYLIAIFLNKIVGFIPSKVFAIHGSIFIFSSDIIKFKNLPFNDKSFLYGEELEFASYIEKNNINIFDSNTTVFHKSHETTKKYLKLKTFIPVWSNSFLNWYNRWYK